MRDAFTIIGKEITYNNKMWTIKEFYYVPNNPNIYVVLFDGISRLNVVLKEISELITKD